MEKKMYETPEMEEIKLKMEKSLLIGGDSGECTADTGDPECEC